MKHDTLNKIVLYPIVILLNLIALALLWTITCVLPVAVVFFAIYLIGTII